MDVSIRRSLLSRSALLLVPDPFCAPFFSSPPSSTLGHSSVDVNLIAYGKGTEVLAGNHESVPLFPSPLFVASRVTLLSLSATISFQERRARSIHD